MVQLLYPYLITGGKKNVALTIWIFAVYTFFFFLNHDCTVEVTYRFKGLDLVSRVPEELTTETEVCNIVQEYQTIPKALEWGRGVQKGKV